jgi:hypothetical protein
MGVSILFTPLQKLLDVFQSERHYKDAKKDAALIAINKALLETKRYLEESQGEGSFDRAQEYKLARLWADAATKARYASGDLAHRLNAKSLYWSEEFKWSSAEVLERRIDLESIQDQVTELLKG